MGVANTTDFCIQNGKCSSDSTFFNSTQVETIARCALSSYDAHLDAHFLWTGHNEIEAKWDYIKAWDNMWINTTAVNTTNTTAFESFNDDLELKFIN